MTSSNDSAALEVAFRSALDYLASLDRVCVAAPASAEEMRARLWKPMPSTGTPAANVVDDLVRDAARGINASQSGRFFSWVIGGGTPAAIAADWLTSVWDQNAGIFATSPAAAVVEEVAGAWLKELLALPREASFAFVTGTQMGHAVCLAAARNATLAKAGWDVERKGMFGAPRVAVFAGAERHGSVDRALRLLGFGADAITSVPADVQGRMDPAGLEAAMAKHAGPAIVALQAGELNLGGFDSFPELVPIARRHDAWVHVDGAFGLWARASAAHGAEAEGIEHCDSWVTDGHKYLNVPYDCGFAFVRDATAHRAAMSLGAVSYLPAHGAARDQIDWNPEFSRRARGFAVYAAIREMGAEGVAELIDRTCSHVKRLAGALAALPGVEALGEPRINQALVRFRDTTPGASEADHARFTDAVIARVNASGEAMFGGVTWRGRRAMRISLCNWRTTDADIDRAAQSVGAAIEATRP